jgi:glycosyltransferase involved in cell wall biosynthesis
MSSRRVTIVASELLGRAGTGGAGTADSLLAVALGRHGHQVELLIASGRDIGPLDAEWTRTYASAGVNVRVLDRLRGVRPEYHAPTLEVFRALRDRPPDVVIADDWRGLAHAALRARQTGLALQETAFVVHCHGPGRVLAEFAAKVPDTVARFAEEVMERASIELADAVVSPSAWLLDWMRGHGWPVPDSATVVQYVRQSAALDEAPPQASDGAPIRRLAFFGQLREGKGVRIFLAALEELRLELLDGVELLFLGSATPRWSAERIASAVSNGLPVRVETGLGREAALAELRRPGTLAVMPSLLDNSPNTVYECIEQRIPFVATATGGIPELVAAEDRQRVLCGPTPGELAAGLRRALADPNGFAPARPAHKPRESLEAWLQVVETVAPPRPTRKATPGQVAVVTNEAGQSRPARLETTDAEWILFLDDEDVPDDGLVDALIAAQQASGADVVTVAVRPADDVEGIHLFLGDPGALGLIENQYGVLGLARRALLAAEPPPDGVVDPDWPLFARLALAGARIVSIPEPLAVHAGSVGRVGDVPGEGLAVLRLFEEAGGGALRDLPQLAATLAAASARAQTRLEPVLARPRILRRAVRVLRAVTGRQSRSP